MAKRQEADFVRAIPGMSMTEDATGRPYTKPPKMNKPEAVVQHYLQKLNSQQGMEAMLAQIEAGIPVKDITEGILRISVSKGLHSIDTGMLAAPIIHEKIKGLGKAFGLNPEDGFDTEAIEKKQDLMKSMASRDAINRIKGPVAAPAPMPVVEEAPKEAKGLIKRRVK